ncbi:hypothetical protein PSTT_10917 [Puccinia striiformis]|uniref:MULE transposase domain-containing protein n=1 Tax=Puccinia striiformis TaxID=27350 RepID=A0A2S4V2A3_9BASI|nr:hypothetical protein PSTT_10917 [Puccinia striiformis]
MSKKFDRYSKGIQPIGTNTNAETSEPPAESSDFPPIPLPPIGSHPSKDACVKSVQQFGMQNRFAVASANQYLVQAQDVDEDEEETNETDEPNNAEGTAPTPGPNAGKTISTLTSAGVPPLKIKNTMMKDKTEVLNAPLRAIHNFNYRAKKKANGGLSPMAAMINCLKEKNFDYKIKSTSGLDEPNHLDSAFFTLPESIHLARQHPTCILIDATYKTNLFKMPLLHIAGINSSNKTFTFAFAFISREKEGDFTWALDQLRLVLSPHVPQVILTDKEQALMNTIEVIFPTAQHLLCQWHMSKNLCNHCCFFK